MSEAFVPVFDVDVPVRGSSVCSVRVKLVGDAVHILDLDGDVSLTNAASPMLQLIIATELARYCSGQTVEISTWVMYHTDSVVSIFSGNSFRAAPAELWDAAMAAEMHRLYGERGIY